MRCRTCQDAMNFQTLTVCMFKLVWKSGHVFWKGVWLQLGNFHRCAPLHCWVKEIWHEIKLTLQNQTWVSKPSYPRQVQAKMKLLALFTYSQVVSNLYTVLFLNIYSNQEQSSSLKDQKAHENTIKAIHVRVIMVY